MKQRHTALKTSSAPSFPSTFSNTGMNPSGFPIAVFASTQNEWYSASMALVSLAGVRREMAHRARWTPSVSGGKPSGMRSVMGTEKRRAQWRRSRSVHLSLSAVWLLG